MRWAGEEIALALTGVLYLAVLGLPHLRKATLSRGMWWSLLGAAAVFLGSSAVLATQPRYPATTLAWLLPLVPVIVMISLMREYARDLAVAASSAPDPAQVDPVEHVDVAPASRDAQEAADPSSSVERLADLAYAHPELHALLAINPSTPASVLEWMASLGDPVVSGAIRDRASHE